MIMLLALPAAAWARFGGTAAAALSAQSDTLGAPTAVSLTKRCGNLLSPSGTATVDWTASTDSYATGYTATLTPSNGSATTKVVTGRTATETSFPITILTTYTVTVATSYRNWTSAAATSGSISCNIFGG
jgi:hypothetical protein